MRGGHPGFILETSLPQFVPVTVADLIAKSAALTAHCNKCGHHATIDPASLPERLHSRSVPSLSGAFACTWCKSRNTCAQPFYREQMRSGAPQAGKGWIMPPAE